MNKAFPLLSIGIIFNNEIRCLERCLNSLTPLREAIPCELVMADTGSNDGSRAVAEQYADILFDFPWIDDFAAARNAVLEHCTGKWCLTVDSDEWLDADCTKLVRFVRESRTEASMVTVIQRNYQTSELDANYSDFNAIRLLRMSHGPRYKGAIHELPEFSTGGVLLPEPQAILHHDGYVDFTGEAGTQKRQRNLKLLREELARTPDDYRRLVQFLDIGMGEPDYLNVTLRALELVNERPDHGGSYGPVIYCCAIQAAQIQGLPEQKTWATKAEALFPKSYFVRLDIAWTMGENAFRAGDYKEAIRLNKLFLRARKDRPHDPLAQREMLFGTLRTDNPRSEASARATLFSALAYTGRGEQALALAEDFQRHWTAMDPMVVKRILTALMDLHMDTLLDTTPMVRAFWEGIAARQPTEQAAKARTEAFIQESLSAFSREKRRRSAWSLFLPLADQNDLGKMVVLLDTEDPDKLTALLAQQENLAQTPAPALFHALEHGAEFPPPGKSLNVETMDALAAALGQDQERLYRLLLSYPLDKLGGADMQFLSWMRALALAALQSFDWKEPTKDSEKCENGFALVQAFTDVERAFLPRCYTAEAIEDGNVLPPMHRFGVYCIRAFDALETKDFISAIHNLSDGLRACRLVKDVVSFLFAEIRRRERAYAVESAPPELKALANQVRTILVAYPPHDPAVAQLKASEEYQKVAYLLED